MNFKKEKSHLSWRDDSVGNSICSYKDDPGSTSAPTLGLTSVYNSTSRGYDTTLGYFVDTRYRHPCRQNTTHEIKMKI